MMACLYNCDSSIINQTLELLQSSLNGTTTTIDAFGNVKLPPNSFSSSFWSPSLSPPWVSDTQKSVTINVPFTLQPIGIVTATDYGGDKTGSLILCSMIPCFGRRHLEKHMQRKLQRVKNIRRKKRSSMGKSFLMSAYHQRKLKRLHRGPFLKAKKQEIYDKWANKKLRQQFRKRYRPEHTMMTSMRERSDSSSQCPLWTCNGTRRNKRHARRRQPSRLCSRSDRSRSPIFMRSSPSSILENS